MVRERETETEKGESEFSSLPRTSIEGQVERAFPASARSSRTITTVTPAGPVCISKIIIIIQKKNVDGILCLED